jgi:hypothetical protein
MIPVDFSKKSELACLFISDELEQDTESTKVADDGIGYLPWRSAQFVFDSVKRFFDSEIYSISILKGLITSSGGLTESTLKASNNSLFEHLSEISGVKDSEGKVDKMAIIE